VISARRDIINVTVVPLAAFSVRGERWEPQRYCILLMDPVGTTYLVSIQRPRNEEESDSLRIMAISGTTSSLLLKYWSRTCEKNVVSLKMRGR
jgi:hypothetical protein